MFDQRTKDRFWSHVTKTDNCWNWNGYLDKNGYGKFGAGGFGWRAHRFAWCITNSSIPDGMYVCHKCDNPSCVRPDHMFIGNQFDNMRDSREKGRTKNAFRYQKGERHYTKLNFETAEIVRSVYSSGKFSQRQIAEIVGVTQTCVSAILIGKTWIHAIVTTK